VPAQGARGGRARRVRGRHRLRPQGGGPRQPGAGDHREADGRGERGRDLQAEDAERGAGRARRSRRRRGQETGPRPGREGARVTRRLSATGRTTIASAPAIVLGALSVLLPFLLFGAGCAGTEMENSVREVRAIAKEAKDHGAVKCAPRELALAETHIEFTERELAQGDYFRARDHLHVADHNAREAYHLSPPEKCLAPVVPPDTDHDGIPDKTDKCPTEPEDKDGFEDADGCPDPDNDKDGIPDKADKCPNEPEDKDNFEDADGCPDPDNDADGILDNVDKCPNEPEDKDGFEDADGCPDPDNDKDGVLDAADKCPNDPGPPDNDGCPKKYEHIVVTPEKIELKQKIFFDTNKATIQPRSFSLLDEIASVLKTRPT